MRMIEKQVVLQSLDTLWREHLVALDHLRQVIGWRGMAQRDPLNEYKSEALELFRGLMTHWDEHGHRAADARRGELRGAALRAAGTAADGNVASKSGRAHRRRRREATALEDLNARLADVDFSARGRGAVAASRSAIPPIPRPGARSAATSPAPAARARNTSTATGS